jgi:hypothetical protein
VVVEVGLSLVELKVEELAEVAMVELQVQIPLLEQLILVEVEAEEHHQHPH